MIKTTLPLLIAALLFFHCPVRATAGDFPIPTDFDPKAPAPPNLPAQLDLPAFTRVTVKVRRQVALDPVSLADKNRLLWDPDLLEAVFESDGKMIHAIYQWEGGRSSEGYQVKKMTFHLGSFKYPDSIISVTGVLGFFLNKQIYVPSGSSPRGGNFPGMEWYAPNRYAGTAELQGNLLLVFTPTPPPPQGNSSPPPPVLYLDAQTLLPTMVESASFLYLFDYAPDPGAVISPSGIYLRAIQQQFGKEADSHP